MVHAAWAVAPALRNVQPLLPTTRRRCATRGYYVSRRGVRAQANGIRAVEVVERVYEDTSDGAMAYHRWTAARAEAEETGLSEKHGTALVYGDVDLGLMLRGLGLAGVQNGDRVVDIGSGYGRVVLTAACAYDGGEGTRVQSVTGIERISMPVTLCARVPSILPMLHEYAREMDRKIRDQWAELPETNFVLGDFRTCERGKHALQKADVVFAFATTWPAVDGVGTELGTALQESLKVGARAVLVDTRLPDAEFDGKRFVLGRFEEENAATGSSTVSVYRVEGEDESERE